MQQMDSVEQLQRIVTTRNVRAKVSRSDIVAALLRHQRSVSGVPNQDGQRHGKRSFLNGCRMLTAHRNRDGTRFWIISECDQSLTRVMLPEDF